MTFEEKYRELESYLELKDELLCLQVERDELRDLKRLSNDMGVPPKGGGVSDPTGNTAVQLAESIEDVECLIQDVKYRMNSVVRTINAADEISQRDKLLLMLKFVRGANNGVIAEKLGLPSRSAVQKRVRRIVQRMA